MISHDFTWFKCGYLRTSLTTASYVAWPPIWICSSKTTVSLLHVDLIWYWILCMSFNANIRHSAAWHKPLVVYMCTLVVDYVWFLIDFFWLVILVFVTMIPLISDQLECSITGWMEEPQNLMASMQAQVSSPPPLLNVIHKLAPVPKQKARYSSAWMWNPNNRACSQVKINVTRNNWNHMRRVNSLFRPRS